MSSKKPTLVVLGATGNQGGSVLSHFLSLTPSPYALRGVTRDEISSEPASLDAAFKGASAIFSVTDYWMLYGSFMAQQQSSVNGQSPMLFAKEKEIQQNKNIIDAAAKVESLERFIFSSLPNIEKLSGGKYSHVHQFDGKAIAEEYGKTTYPELWKKTSVLYAGFFLENYLKPDASAYRPKLDIAKNMLSLGAVGTVHLPMFSAKANTGPIVHALLRDSAGQKVIASNAWLTFQDSAKTLANVLNKDIEFTNEQPSFNISDPELGQNFADMMGWYIEFNYDGSKVDKSVKQPKDLGVESHLMSVEEWCRKQDWERILDVI
ncbi:unnamed protein product [Alternaria alternata]